MRDFKKTNIKPWLAKEWCIPEASAEYVAKMEDVLGVYERPYDACKPVVCIDETNKQLIEETRIPSSAEHPELKDSVFERKGVADVCIWLMNHLPEELRQ